jgi:hypothetical protein
MLEKRSGSQWKHTLYAGHGAAEQPVGDKKNPTVNVEDRECANKG